MAHRRWSPPADPATADYLHNLDTDQRLRAVARQQPQVLPYLGSR